MNIVDRIMRAKNDIRDIIEIIHFDYKDMESHRHYRSRIKKFYEWRSTSGIGAENKKNNLELYKALSWNNEDYFDVIDSFSQIFALGLYIFDENNKYVNLNNKVKLSEDKRIYVSSVKFQTNLLSEELSSDVKMLINLEELQEYALLVHTIGNFIPCFSVDANIVKGTHELTMDIFDIYISKLKENNVLESRVLGKKHKIISEEILKEYDDKNDLLLLDYSLYNIVDNLDEVFSFDREKYRIFINLLNLRIKIRTVKMIQKINPKLSVCQEWEELYYRRFRKLEKIIKD